MLRMGQVLLSSLKYDNAISILGGILDKSGASLGDDTVVVSRKLYIDVVILRSVKRGFFLGSVRRGRGLLGSVYLSCYF